MRLPPYSQGHKLIEEAFAKVKAALRSLAKRTVPDVFAGPTVSIKRGTTDEAKAVIARSVKRFGYVLLQRTSMKTVATGELSTRPHAPA